MILPCGILTINLRINKNNNPFGLHSFRFLHKFKHTFILSEKSHIGHSINLLIITLEFFFTYKDLLL